MWVLQISDASFSISTKDEYVDDVFLFETEAKLDQYVKDKEYTLGYFEYGHGGWSEYYTKKELEVN